MRRRRLLALAVAAAALTLTACVATGPSVVTSGRFAAVVDAPETASADALISGILDVDHQGCWVLRDSDGAMHEVVWPSGTRLSGTTLQLPGLRDALGAGTKITGGGGSGTSKRGYPPCIATGDEATYIDNVAVSP
jgi:hypothetical protein